MLKFGVAKMTKNPLFYTSTRIKTCQAFFRNFSNFLNLFSVLVIEQTMAVTLEIGVCDLLTELLADALILLGTLQAAGTVTAGAF